MKCCAHARDKNCCTLVFQALTHLDSSRSMFFSSFAMDDNKLPTKTVHTIAFPFVQRNMRWSVQETLRFGTSAHQLSPALSSVLRVRWSQHQLWLVRAIPLLQGRCIDASCDRWPSSTSSTERYVGLLEGDARRNGLKRTHMRRRER